MEPVAMQASSHLRFEYFDCCIVCPGITGSDVTGSDVTGHDRFLSDPTTIKSAERFL